MIKIDNAMKPLKITKGKSRKDKQVLKFNTISERNSLEGNDELENNSNVQLQDEEAAEGGEEEIKQAENSKDLERRSEENKEPSMLHKSNTNVKMSLSARVKPKLNNKDEPPESPLPVIKINNKDKVGVDANTNEETPIVHDQDNIVSDDDNPETSRQLKNKKNPKKKKKERFVNLKLRYDGFNKLRFVYSRIIPR